MTDQPKPISVEEARMALYNASDKSRHDAEDALIAAVERRERARVLAEFRKLTNVWGDRMVPDRVIEHAIKSLETPN